MASVYAPICYGPLPLLAFKVDPATGAAQLAANGTLRSCDPDRIVLKKIVLSGYPMKVGCLTPHACLPCLHACPPALLL